MSEKVFCANNSYFLLQGDGIKLAVGCTLTTKIIINKAAAH
jgi:hypothetical protein